jgi:hypothetical protein
LVASREQNGDVILWKPEEDRVRAVIVKLARGHVAYEQNEPQLDEPANVAIVPLCVMSDETREAFEISPNTGLWPEVGKSRAGLSTRARAVGCSAVLSCAAQLNRPPHDFAKDLHDEIEFPRVNPLRQRLHRIARLHGNSRLCHYRASSVLGVDDVDRLGSASAGSGPE